MTTPNVTNQILTEPQLAAYQAVCDACQGNNGPCGTYQGVYDEAYNSFTRRAALRGGRQTGPPDAALLNALVDQLVPYGLVARATVDGVDRVGVTVPGRECPLFGFPTVLAAAVTATGLYLVVTFDRAVTGHSTFTLTSSGVPVGLTYLSGEGTTEVTFELDRIVLASETDLELTYARGDVRAAVGGLYLASPLTIPVTNGSAVANGLLFSGAALLFNGSLLTFSA